MVRSFLNRFRLYPNLNASLTGEVSGKDKGLRCANVTHAAYEYTHQTITVTGHHHAITSSPSHTAATSSPAESAESDARQNLTDGAPGSSAAPGETSAHLRCRSDATRTPQLHSRKGFPNVSPVAASNRRFASDLRFPALPILRIRPGTTVPCRFFRSAKV